MRKNKQTNKQTNTTMTPNGNIPHIKKNYIEKNSNEKTNSDGKIYKQRNKQTNKNYLASIHQIKKKITSRKIIE